MEASLQPTSSRPSSRRSLGAVRPAASSLLRTFLEADPGAVETVGKVIRKLVHVTPAWGAGLGLLEGPQLVFRFTQGALARGVGLPLETPLIESCLRSRAAVRADRPEVAASFAPVTGDESRAVILVPIRPGEDVLGMVALTSPKADAFRDEDLETAQLLTELITGTVTRVVENQMNEALIADCNRALEGWGETSTTLQSFFAAAPLLMGVLVLDGEEIRCQALNVEATRWLEQLGKEGVTSPSERGAALAPPQVVAACIEAEEKQAPVRVEYSGPDGEGATHHFVSTVSALPRTRASGRQFCLVTEDVTPAVQMRAQLQLADRMVSLGTLAAGVAHEINNPLSFVRTNLNFAIDEIGQPEAAMEEIRTSLSEVREGVERVTRIVRDLKTLSHPDQADVSVTNPQASVASAVRVATGEVGRTAKLTTSYEAMPDVRGGGHRLIQVILNLLVNAAQAIPAGKSHENEVRVATRTDGRGWALIEVSDTGPGIPEKIQSRIFDPFFTTKPVGVGTGLGLSICYGIINQLGGELTFQTAAGQGTTFRVALPPA